MILRTGPRIQNSCPSNLGSEPRIWATALYCLWLVELQCREGLSPLTSIRQSASTYSTPARSWVQGREVGGESDTKVTQDESCLYGALHCNGWHKSHPQRTPTQAEQASRTEAANAIHTSWEEGKMTSSSKGQSAPRKSWHWSSIGVAQSLGGLC